ncbi:MAG: GWxTD domain-containing protein [Flavobacteriales bacterium]|nr:GWxTD domain-containing protein [Flavobacteriales bacterium]
MNTLRLLVLSICLGTSLNAMSIRLTFDYRVFHAPDKGPYVEFYASFDGRTLSEIPADSGLFRSKVEMMIVLSRNGQIVDYSKEIAESDMFTKGSAADFMTISRFALSQGIYDLELEITDLGIPGSEVTKYAQKVEINNPATGAFISDIEFVSAYRPAQEQTHFTKAGYDIMPYNSDYFPASLKSLMFYAEIYNTDVAFGAGEPFVSDVSIVDSQGRVIEQCRRMKKEKANQVIPILHTLDISALTSGEYKVKIEIRDRENKLVYLKERSFSRARIEESSPETMVITDLELYTSFASSFQDRDVLYAHILYHLPIAGDIDRNTIDYTLKNADLKTLQSFLYSFWLKRNPEDPNGAWKKYNESIRIVDQNFSTKSKAGWQTDRGRVYLQYGKPNTRVIRPSDSDYWPYEIWHYYVTDGNLHNRRFLFYDTNLSGDMELLHSDVPSEIKNYFWKDMVKSRPMALNMGDASEKNANQRRDPNSRDEIEDLWYNPH